MGRKITVDQHDTDGGGFAFIATLWDVADDGTETQINSTSASIGAVIGMPGWQVFTEGAGMALQQMPELAS